MPVPATVAWQEAEASAPPGVETLHTIELQHNATLLARWVAEVTEPETLGIEDGAAFNGGELAEFTPTNFKSAWPDVGENTPPRSRLSIDNVPRQAIDLLIAATLIRSDLIVIYRQYLSDDTSAPAFGPVEYVMRSWSAKGTRVTGDAELLRLGNKRFPATRATYNVSDFPGLVVG
jgi:hypothetical protein